MRGIRTYRSGLAVFAECDRSASRTDALQERSGLPRFGRAGAAGVRAKLPVEIDPPASTTDGPDAMKFPRRDTVFLRGEDGLILT